MNSIQINLTIAEQLGTHSIIKNVSDKEEVWNVTDFNGLTRKYFWTLPDGANGWQSAPDFQDPKDYYMSLDACADFEATLTNSEYSTFEEYIKNMLIDEIGVIVMAF